MDAKTIVFFPEAAFGPSMNCVGIAQRLRERGHNAVFVVDSSFKGVFDRFGFPERLVAMSEPMDEAAASQYWLDFIASHQPHFRLSPIDQIPTTSWNAGAPSSTRRSMWRVNWRSRWTRFDLTSFASTT